MSTAPIPTVETEEPSPQVEAVSDEIGASCPTCPPKPQVSVCPYEKDSPEWKSWYEHFGHQLVRWSQSLARTISQMSDDCSNIKWGDLGLHDVEIIKEAVPVTRLKEKPVVNTDDDGVTLAINCDIVTYGGTGVLINKGKGVVMNLGSGIVINYSTGTCTNTNDGIIICFGKCTLVNSGTGFGIIESCKVKPDERIRINDAGGMLIKDVGHMSKRRNGSRWDINSNEDSSDESHSLNEDSIWSDIEIEFSELETESDADEGSLYETVSSCSEDYSTTESHIDHNNNTDTSSGKETASAEDTDTSDLSDSDEECSVESASNPSQSDGESALPGPTISNNETSAESDGEPMKSLSQANTASDKSLSSGTGVNDNECVEHTETESFEVQTLCGHVNCLPDIGDNAIDNTAPTARE